MSSWYVSDWERGKRRAMGSGNPLPGHGVGIIPSPTEGTNTRIVGKRGAQGGNLGSAGWSREPGIAFSTQPWPAQLDLLPAKPRSKRYFPKKNNSQTPGETDPSGKHSLKTFPLNHGWNLPGTCKDGEVPGWRERSHPWDCSKWGISTAPEPLRIRLLPASQGSPAWGRSWRWAR